MKRIIITVALLALPFYSFAQDDSSLRVLIQVQDNAFFDAFNKCDFENWKKYLAEDIEFYQDNDKVTHSRKELEPAFMGRCGKSNVSKLRRELIPETLEVHPIQDFGALEMGSHRFYVVEPGKPDKLEATPKFIHLWRYKDGAWQITRVISYSHH